MEYSVEGFLLGYKQLALIIFLPFSPFPLHHSAYRRSDDTLFLFLTEKTLDKYRGQLSIKSIDNVKEALAFLEACKVGEHHFPDGIFVDLNMPAMCGMDFASLYNEQYAPLFPNTKLVMLTSSISRKEREKAMNIPAVSDFIQKPLTKEKLTELL